MQIAICHDNVVPARGGAETYVADLTRRLAAAGHDVLLYATQWDDAALPSSVVRRRLPAPWGPRAVRPWRFSATVRHALAKDRPEVSIGFDKLIGTDVYYPLGGLHVATAAHNLLKHRPGWQRLTAKGIQLADHVHWSFVEIERRLLTGEGRPLFVANSDLVRQHAVEHYGIDPADVPVIHNAIDSHRFDETDRPRLRNTMRSLWGFAPTDVVGAVVAMNYRLKGLAPLLRSLRLLRPESPFKLLVAGSPKTALWKWLARRLGVADRVRFVGHCPDARRVYFAADFLVHPTFYDPCSLVVLEALACGLPIITTKNNGAGERMRPPAEGFIINDPHNRFALADRISDLLDADRRAACAKAAREAARAWTFDHHVRAFESVLAHVVQRRQAAG